MRQPGASSSATTYHTPSKLHTTLAGIMKRTGFEEFFCEAPLTPAEHREEREVYAPHKPFHDRIEECVQRFRARRRLNSTRENILSTYLRLGGIDTAPRAFQGVRNLDADDLTRSEARLMSATDVIFRGDEDPHAGVANPRFFNPNYADHWDVDFAGVVSGFLSDQFMTSFGNTAKEYCEGVQVIKNFLTYVLRHDVCPEYEADVREALRVCTVATEEMPVISELYLQLPGAFNRSISVLCPSEPDARGDGEDGNKVKGDAGSTARPVDEAVYMFDDWKAGARVSARLAVNILGLVHAAWIAGVLPPTETTAAAKTAGATDGENGGGKNKAMAEAPPFARDREFLDRLARGRVAVSPTRDRVYEVVRVVPPPPPRQGNALADRVRGAFRHAGEHLLNGGGGGKGDEAGTALDEVEEVAEAISQFEWGWGEKEDEEAEKAEGDAARSERKRKDALHQKRVDAACARTVGLCGFFVAREVVLRDAFDRGIPATEEAPTVPVAALASLQAAASAAAAGPALAGASGGGGGGDDGTHGDGWGKESAVGKGENCDDDDDKFFVLEEQVLALLRPGMRLGVTAASVEGRFVLVRQIRAVHPTFYRFLPQALMLKYKEPVLNPRPAPSIHDANNAGGEEAFDE